MDLYQNRSIKFKQCENPPPPKNILICFDGRKVAGVAAGRVQGMRDLLIRFKLQSCAVPPTFLIFVLLHSGGLLIQ